MIIAIVYVALMVSIKFKTCAWKA